MRTTRRRFSLDQVRSSAASAERYLDALVRFLEEQAHA
jgi:hypothetical protein